jgi:ribosome maturation factor RimP
LDERLQLLIEPIVKGLGCDLWGIEYLPHGKHSMLRVFIDSQDGVDVKDCERISRQISSVLDVEDPLDGKYVLEVSSPGIDRRLFTQAQFEQYAGANVKINLRSPYEGRRKFSGQLCGVEAGDVVIRIDEDEYLLPFEGIDRASIIPDFK